MLAWCSEPIIRSEGFSAWRRTSYFRGHVTFHMLAVEHLGFVAAGIRKKTKECPYYLCSKTCINLGFTIRTIWNFYSTAVEENFERKMFVDTRINACTHKTRQTCNSFSLLPFQEDCLLFFASFIFEIWKGGGGVATPVTPLSIRQWNIINQL